MKIDVPLLDPENIPDRFTPDRRVYGGQVPDDERRFKLRQGFTADHAPDEELTVTVWVYPSDVTPPPTDDVMREVQKGTILSYEQMEVTIADDTHEHGAALEWVVDPLDLPNMKEVIWTMSRDQAVLYLYHRGLTTRSATPRAEAERYFDRLRTRVYG